MRPLSRICRLTSTPQLRPMLSSQRKMRSYYQSNAAMVSPFVAPNETNPSRARDILNSAQPGAYVGVGTDRCLFAPVLSDKIDAIYMTDFNPSICLFNKINLAMLKACPDRASYLALREAADFQEFSRILDQLRYETDPGLVNLRESSHYLWLSAVLQHKNFLHYTDKNEDFAKLSYLFSDAAYQRIHSLVAEGRVHVVHYDIACPSSRESLSELLKENQDQVGVYDLSNAYWCNFVSPHACPQRIFLLGCDEMPESTTILLSDSHGAYGNPWFYMGFNKGQLQDKLKANPKYLKEKFDTSLGFSGRNSLADSFGVANIDKLVDLDNAQWARPDFCWKLV